MESEISEANSDPSVDGFISVCAFFVLAISTEKQRKK